MKIIEHKGDFEKAIRAMNGNNSVSFLHKNIRLTLTFILIAIALNSHAFEYRIISNVADSTLNGSEISLSNNSDWGTEDFGVVENGIIDIKGESKRSFPATLNIRNNNPDNPKSIVIKLIVEPGIIVVDVNSNIPISGGELTDGMKVWMNRMNEVDDIQEAYEICREVLKENVNNGLGELVLINYGSRCSPKEWTDAIALLDEETRNLAAIDQITGRKERLAPVWEGQPFKDLEGKDLDGNTINLSKYVGKGKYVVADLWASWCVPCILLAKNVLKPIYEKYKENTNVQFLGIAMDDISKVVDMHDIPWAQIMDCKKMMGTYVIASIPEVIIFGPDGTILRRYTHEFEIEKIFSEVLPQD